MGTGGTRSLQSPKTWERVRSQNSGIRMDRFPHSDSCLLTPLSLNIDGTCHKVACLLSNAQRLRCALNPVSTVDFMVKPNGLLVTVSSAHYCTYTSVLSTWWSSTALRRIFTSLGDLILGEVSRLYAFSAYPDRTSLPSDAAGATTGSQEVRPSRSSRTKGRPPQISYAHHR